MDCSNRGDVTAEFLDARDKALRDEIESLERAIKSRRASLERTREARRRLRDLRKNR